MAHSDIPTTAGLSKKQTLENAGLTKSVANRCEKIAETSETHIEYGALMGHLTAIQHSK